MAHLEGHHLGPLGHQHVHRHVLAVVQEAEHDAERLAVVRAALFTMRVEISTPISTAGSRDSVS